MLRWEQNYSLCHSYWPRHLGCLVISVASWDRQTGAYKVATGRNKFFFMEHVFGSEMHFFREKWHMRLTLADAQKHSLGRPWNDPGWGGGDTNWPGGNAKGIPPFRRGKVKEVSAHPSARCSPAGDKALALARWQRWPCSRSCPLHPPCLCVALDPLTCYNMAYCSLGGCAWIWFYVIES